MNLKKCIFIMNNSQSQKMDSTKMKRVAIIQISKMQVKKIIVILLMKRKQPKKPKFSCVLEEVFDKMQLQMMQNQKSIARKKKILIFQIKTQQVNHACQLIKFCRDKNLANSRKKMIIKEIDFKKKLLRELPLYLMESQKKMKSLKTAVNNDCHLKNKNQN